jgi:hypothetical protein
MAKSKKSRKSRKRSTHLEFAPVIRAISKKKPRGIPFKKNNPIGRETRFVKGAPSANPGGRPRVAKLNQAIREGLAADSDKSLPMNTNAQVLAAQVIRQAKAGNLNAINVAGDRAEGPESPMNQIAPKCPVHICRSMGLVGEITSTVGFQGKRTLLGHGYRCTVPGCPAVATVMLPESEIAISRRRGRRR